MTLVATQVKRRRGTTAENDAFTGAEGEIVVDTERHELRVHDGSTVGGYRIPTTDYGYSKTESDNLLSNKADTDLSNITNAGKEVCANMSMPSRNITSLSIGASGTIYTAPADGYFWLRLLIDSGGFVQISIPGLVALAWTMPSQRQFSYAIPVSKGSELDLGYSGRISTNFEFLAFVYANGAQ